MSNTFGQSGFGPTVIEAIPNKYPKYTFSYAGAFSDVNFSASVYAASGWDVTVTSGNPAVMNAFIQCELNSNGITPISSSGAYNTVNWSMHYEVTEKSILHAGVAYIPWITQLTETQINILEKCLSDPPTGSLLSAYPQFDTATSSLTGNPPVTFSSSYGSYTAGDVVWNMAQMGQRDIPIGVPVLRYTSTVGSGFSLTNLVSNTFPQPCLYSAATLISTWGVSSNYAAVVTAISNAFTNPSTTLTYGIPYSYAWQKQYPTIDEQGTVTNNQLEFKFGLWPQNIYGAPM